MLNCFKIYKYIKEYIKYINSLLLINLFVTELKIKRILRCYGRKVNIFSYERTVRGNCGFCTVVIPTTMGASQSQDHCRS